MINCDKKMKSNFCKELVPHVSLTAMVLLYLVMGARVYSWAGRNSMSSFAQYERHELVENGTRGLDSKIDTNEWTFRFGLRFAFSILTTIGIPIGILISFGFDPGFGHVGPTKWVSKVFLMAYALIGILMTMMCIGDWGKFLQEAIRKLLARISKRFNKEDKVVTLLAAGTIGGHAVDIEEERFEIEESLICSTFIVIVTFMSWVVIGMTCVPYWQQLSLTDSGYFLVMTSIGLGDIYPDPESIWLIPILIYLFVGLAITSMGIEIVVCCIMSIHFRSRQLRNVKVAPVWIKGSRVSCGRLIQGVLLQSGVDCKKIREIIDNLDMLVQNVACDDVRRPKPYDPEDVDIEYIDGIASPRPHEDEQFVGDCSDMNANLVKECDFGQNF